MKYYATEFYHSGIKHLLVMVDTKTIKEAERGVSPPFHFKLEYEFTICLYNLSTNSYYGINENDIALNKAYPSHLKWIII